jgi:hypothetical protein
VSRDPAPVCRGVRFLDEHVPGWEHEIDLDTLDLDSTERCVLGQLWLAGHPRARARGNAYVKMLTLLKLPAEVASSFGFDTESDDTEDDTYDDDLYDRLTKAWKRVIRRRLKAHTA